jgi:hypothetical protein
MYAMGLTTVLGIAVINLTRRSPPREEGVVKYIECQVVNGQRVYDFHLVLESRNRRSDMKVEQTRIASINYE